MAGTEARRPDHPGKAWCDRTESLLLPAGRLPSLKAVLEDGHVAVPVRAVEKASPEARLFNSSIAFKYSSFKRRQRNSEYVETN